MGTRPMRTRSRISAAGVLLLVMGMAVACQSSASASPSPDAAASGAIPSFVGRARPGGDASQRSRRDRVPVLLDERPRLRGRRGRLPVRRLPERSRSRYGPGGGGGGPRRQRGGRPDREHLRLPGARRHGLRPDRSVQGQCRGLPARSSGHPRRDRVAHRWSGRPGTIGGKSVEVAEPNADFPTPIALYATGTPCTSCPLPTRPPSKPSSRRCRRRVALNPVLSGRSIVSDMRIRAALAAALVVLLLAACQPTTGGSSEAPASVPAATSEQPGATASSLRPGVLDPPCQGESARASRAGPPSVYHASPMTPPATTSLDTEAFLSPEHRAWLLEKLRWAVMATIGKDGMPSLSVVWFDLDPDQDVVLLNTLAGRLKHRHLERDPRVSPVLRGRGPLPDHRGTGHVVRGPRDGRDLGHGPSVRRRRGVVRGG